MNMFGFVIILNYLFFDKEIEIEIETISILLTHYNNIATESYTNTNNVF